MHFTLERFYALLSKVLDKNEAQSWVNRLKLCEAELGFSILQLVLWRECFQKVHTRHSYFLTRAVSQEIDDQIKASLQLQKMLVTWRDQLTVSYPKELPASFFEMVPSEKIISFDRVWEFSIAQVAVNEQWKFHWIDSTLPIVDVERWDRRLKNRLWPHGVVLFSESAGSSDIPNRFWKGRWLLVLSPKW